MIFLPRFARSLAVAALVALVGCQASVPVIERTSDPLITRPRPVDEAPPNTIVDGVVVTQVPAATSPPRPAATVRTGTGQMINERAAATPLPAATGVGEATFNFEGESLHAVVKAILGDL